MPSEFASWPAFTIEEADAVKRVLLSNRVNYWGGQEGREFEQEFAAATGCRYAVALANGTVALDLALHALGIGPGDEVIVTPRTFIASVSAVANAGARPVFADVDRDSQNITAATIEPKLTPRTRAILCVHLAGWPCDMDPILALADQHGCVVVEDCAQAHGGRYKGRPVGSMGPAAAWSFCQDKIITTGGEGGMLTTNDESIWLRSWSYKDHGKSWEAVYERSHAPGFRWLHESFGTNWRLTEMQAAIGRIQLARLESWSDGRRAHASQLTESFARLSALRVCNPPSEIRHAYYKYYVFVRGEALASGWDRDRILHELDEAGIPCGSGICPEVYLEKAFDGTGFRPEARLANAKELGETSLMFPVHPTLSDAEIGRIGDAVAAVVRRATR